MILERIKKETYTRHVSLESSQAMSPVTNKTLDDSSYIKILLKFYGFYNPLEEIILREEGVKKYLPDLTSRIKSEKILEDLRYLKVPSALDKCKDTPSIENLSDAFGCLYVMEGSTLGARGISRIISETLGYQTGKGASFFHGYGEETGPRWKLFQEALLKYSSESKDDQRIIDSANETFRKFENWLSEP